MNSSSIIRIGYASDFICGRTFATRRSSYPHSPKDFAISSHIPRCHHVLLDAGHMVPQETPLETAQNVVGYLNAVFPELVVEKPLHVVDNAEDEIGREMEGMGVQSKL